MTELVLHEAAVNGEYQQLESMLMIQRIDIDHKDEDFGDRTALHWAASKASTLEKEKRSFIDEQITALSLRVSLVSKDMTNQEKPQAKTFFNASHDLLLHETCALGDDTKLEELGSFIRGGKIDVNSRDEEWGERTAMHCAAHRGHAKCVKLLLEYGADPTARMVGGWTPAHCAAETGRLTVLKVLTDHQAPVMIADNSGDTPKRVAEIYGHTACVELLESAEDSTVQKQLLIRDKFRSNTRKISRIVAEKGLESLQDKVADVAS